MNTDRPTTWTPTAPPSWGTEAWERHTGKHNSVRMKVWESDGAWHFNVAASRSPAGGILRSPWDDGPSTPTREEAQAAAEQWVREWARGLLEAVGPWGEGRRVAERGEGERGLFG